MEIESSLCCQIEGPEALSTVLTRMDQMCRNISTYNECTYQILSAENNSGEGSAANPKLAGLFYCVRTGESQNLVHSLCSKSAIDLGKGRTTDTRNIVRLRLGKDESESSVTDFFAALGMTLSPGIAAKFYKSVHFSGIQIIVSTVDELLYTVQLAISYDNPSLTPIKEQELTEFSNCFQE